MIELKPCPFCGGEAIVKQTAYGTTDLNSCKLSFDICCGKCSAKAPNGYGYIAFNLGRNGEINRWHDDMPKAAEAWNKRVDNYADQR